MSESRSSISSISRSYGAGQQAHQDGQQSKHDAPQAKDEATPLPMPPVTLSPTLANLQVGHRIEVHVTGRDAYDRLLCTHDKGHFCVEGLKASDGSTLKLEITSLKPLRALDNDTKQAVSLYILSIKGPVKLDEEKNTGHLAPKTQAAPQSWDAAQALHLASGGGLPIEDGELYNNVQAFWQALKTGSAEAWTGTELRAQMHQDNVSDMWTSLQLDLALLSEALFETQDWVPWVFPFIQDGQVQLLTLFCNQQGFSLELHSPTHGRMILSGNEEDGGVTLHVQSEKELSQATQFELYQSVKDLCSASKLTFKTGPVYDPRRPAL